MRGLFIIFLLFPALLLGQHIGRYPFSRGINVSSPGYDYTSLEHWYPLISDFNDAHGSDDGTNTGAYQGDSLINGKVATYFEESEDDYVTLDNGTNYGSNTVSLFVTYKPHQFDGNVGIHAGGSGAACFLIDGDAHPMLLDRDGNYVTSTLTLLVGYENFVGWSYAQDRNKVRFYVNGDTEVLNYVEEFSAITDGIGGDEAGYSIDGLLQNLAIWSDSLTETNFDYYYNSGDFKGYEE